MLSNKFKELESYKAKVVEMEKAVLAEREAQLKRLHLDMGFASQDELIKALRGAGSVKKVPVKRGRKKAAAPAAAAKKAPRKRAKITPELRQKIVDAVATGGKGAAVAKKFGVSLPTVQNIKKAAGLVKKAGAGAPTAATAG